MILPDGQDVDFEVIPQTNEQRQAAMLAFVGIVGGGLIAYEAGRAIRDGDLFATDALPEPNPKAGVVATVAGLGMLALMSQEAAKDVGWKPLLWGTAAITGLAVVMRFVRK